MTATPAHHHPICTFSRLPGLPSKFHAERLSENIWPTRIGVDDARLNMRRRPHGLRFQTHTIMRRCRNSTLDRLNNFTIVFIGRTLPKKSRYRWQAFSRNNSNWLPPLTLGIGRFSDDEHEHWGNTRNATLSEIGPLIKEGDVWKMRQHNAVCEVVRPRRHSEDRTWHKLDQQRFHPSPPRLPRPPAV